MWSSAGVIKLSTMRWVLHITTWGKSEILKTFWSESLKGKDCSGHLGVDTGMILKYIFGWSVKVGLDSTDSGKGPMAGFCVRGNELWSSIKTGNLLPNMSAFKQRPRCMDLMSVFFLRG
jgi:hypothetical protein